MDKYEVADILQNYAALYRCIFSIQQKVKKVKKPYDLLKMDM